MRKILTYPNKLLSNVADDVKLDDHTLCVVDELIDTMYMLKAAGVAANQIGDTGSIFVIDVDGNPLVAINPTVHEMGETVEMDEACLSLPGVSAKVSRAKYVRLIYLTLDGDLRSDFFEGIQAQAIQHEMNHLNGELYWNNLSTFKKDLLKKKYKKLHKFD